MSTVTRKGVSLDKPVCLSAVDCLESRLESLVHPEAGLIKLVQFSHQSPGLLKLRRQIAEALVMLLEQTHVIEAL